MLNLINLQTWIVGGDDEELYVRGPLVVWSVGGHVHRCFTLPSPVYQVCAYPTSCSYVVID
jgi:hypothetical protein